MKNKKAAKGIWPMALGLGLVLMSAVPALADQIVVCQSCTSAPGGDPNMITDTSGFNMFLSGNSATSLSPTLIVIAEYNGVGTPTVSVGGTDLSLATTGTWGLNSLNGTSFTSFSNVFTALGLSAGGSLSFGNLSAADTAAGFDAPTSFTLYAFAYNSGLTHTPITVGTTAMGGSFIFGYGCSETPMNGTCSPNGNISQSVMTNAGLVPEPASLLLLGAGLVAVGIWRRKAFKV